MTTEELNTIVQAVVEKINEQVVDFDVVSSTPESTDLLSAVRSQNDGTYQGVTLKWDDVANAVTREAKGYRDDAQTAKTNVENMKASVEQTVSDFNTLADEKKAEVQGVYQTDLNELKGDLEQFKINLYRGGVHDSTTNYIDKSALTHGVYIKGQDKGQTIQADTLNATDFIELQENTDYYLDTNLIFLGYYAFYDSNKNYISGHGNDLSLTSPFRIPSGAKYARFTISDAGLTNSWIFTSNVKPPSYKILDRTLLNDIHVSEEETDRIVKLASEGGDNPCDFRGNDIVAFNKCLCIGDSLTEGVFNHKDSGTTEYLVDSKYSYPNYLSKLTNLQVTNKGHGGFTSAEWYNSEKNNDFSGYDICIIQLGVNDSIRYNGWTQTSVTAFTNIINKVKNENKNIIIFVATIMPSISFADEKIDEISAGIRQFVSSLNDRKVILLDMAMYAHTIEDAYNCGHLSAYGYYRLAMDYSNYISWYMYKNKEIFKEIQFIGTDYWYDNPNS